MARVSGTSSTSCIENGKEKNGYVMPKYACWPVEGLQRHAAYETKLKRKRAKLKQPQLQQGERQSHALMR